MTILEAIKNVADEAGYSVDTTIEGTQDVTTIQLLAIANRLIGEMAIAHEWTKLFASGSITLAAGVSSYALPAAFFYEAYDTFWNQSTQWRVLGPMSPQEYAAIRGTQENFDINSSYQLRGISDTRLLISPTPGVDDAGEVIIFEYFQNRPVKPQRWVGGLHITTGDFCEYNGNYYEAADSAITDDLPPTHTEGTESDHGVNWTYYDGVYDRFRFDTDEPVLSQRVLEQGMLERFGAIHGITVEPKFDDQLAEVIGKDVPGKVMYAGRSAQTMTLQAFNGRVAFGRPR